MVTRRIVNQGDEEQDKPSCPNKISQELRMGYNLTEEAHYFRVVAWWAAESTGIAKCASAPNAIHFTAPPAFGGLDGRWTPEDLLLCALAGCFTTTFRAVAESSKFLYTDLQVEVEGDVSRSSSGYHFRKVLIRPQLTIQQDAGETQAIALLEKTWELCLVSRALSMEQKFDPYVQVGQLVAQGGRSSAVSDK